MSELSSKIEPYVLLGRSAKGVAAVKVIKDATASPGVYSFAELLELPNMQQLAHDPSSEKSFNMLKLYAYGNLIEYINHTDRYPTLSPVHLQKLKHLTLVSLALRSRSLPYDILLRALQLQSTRELEDLIIDTIYAGLLKGKIYHRQKILHVDWVTGRDLRPEDLLLMQKGLQAWCQNAGSLLAALDKQINMVRQDASSETEKNQRYVTDRNYFVSQYLEKKQGKKAVHLDLTKSSDTEMTAEAAVAEILDHESTAAQGLSGGKKVLFRGEGSKDEDERMGMRGPKRFKDSP